MINTRRHPETGRAPALRSRAFSILELLVVISVVSVLISILVPSLVAARESARRIMCAGSLRSLGTATVIYANEYDGLPVSSRHIGFAPTLFETSNMKTVRFPSDDRLELVHALRIGLDAEPPSITSEGEIVSSQPWLCPSEQAYDPGPHKTPHIVDGFSYEYYAAVLQASTIKRPWWWDRYRVPTDSTVARVTLRRYESDPSLILMRDDEAFHGHTGSGRPILNVLTFDGSVNLSH